jgi:DNA-binding PadR family transcriptional regulator
MTAAQSFSGHLELVLLAALEDGPQHGYGVIEHVRRRSGGRFDYPEGTVYPALHRLEEEGLLHSGWQRESGRRRRIYRLTPRGREELHGRRSDWEQHARGIAALLGQGHA